MGNETDDNSRIGFEIAFAALVGCGLFVGNILIAVAADQFSLFDVYLKASVLILPGISLLVVVKAKLLKMSGVGALLLGLIAFAISLLNQLFVGYGEMG